MTDFAIGYARKDYKNHVTLDYALYANFTEAKTSLLNIMAACGLDMLELGIKDKSVSELGKATIELMMMKEEETGSLEENVLSYDTPHFLFFMTRGDGSKLKEMVKEMPDETITMELLADHRKCTIDFCYSSLQTNVN